MQTYEVNLVGRWYRPDTSSWNETNYLSRIKRLAKKAGWQLQVHPDKYTWWASRGTFELTCDVQAKNKEAAIDVAAAGLADVIKRTRMCRRPRLYITR